MADIEFKVGDIVKHKSKFLRDTGWYTDVPKDGIVRSIADNGFPRVQWCDREEEGGHMVHPGNIMHASAPDYT